MRVELRGLSAQGYVGVTEAERQVLRRIVLDISFTVLGAVATATDELEGTVDYGAVGELATGVVRDGSPRTLEHLCARVADEIGSRYDVADLEVRAAKPDPPMAQVIDEVAVVLRRSGPPAR